MVDRQNSQIDCSHGVKFTEAVAKKVYYDPVYASPVAPPQVLPSRDVLRFLSFEDDAGASVPTFAICNGSRHVGIRPSAPHHR
jgi:hypothetical protein